MLLNMHWLRDFLPYEGTAEALGSRLTMLGLELEDIQRPFENIAAFRIGRVLTCAPHPESDHLSITTVDIGEQSPIPIVCGAPNVAAGQLVPVAPVGTTMPNGLLIKAAAMRGEKSHGMICSERELGLSEDHEGIMVLNDMLTDAAIGTRFVDAFKLDMEVLDIGITPNRADCLSVLGLAREVALAYKLPLSLPPTNLIEHDDDTPKWHIDVPNGDLCPAYHARFINAIKLKAAPLAVRARLLSVGIRPISNIVDVTNYILIELGQPLHAFDRNRLNGKRIEISPAREGERITTLDGQERVLKTSDLLVRDSKGDADAIKTPIALAGVMGGLDSEVTHETTDILLESAVFSPSSVRKTARRLGLSSEASTRFERGVDPLMTVYAMDRAAAMMAELSGGSVSKQVASTVSQTWTAPTPIFRTKRANDILGMPIEADFAKATLEGLGCELTPTNTPAVWDVKTPSWRHDLTREIDLIEEVARVRGMDNLPETLPAILRDINAFGTQTPRPLFIQRLKLWASGIGLNEVINYSFVGHKDLDHLGLPKDDRITIMNPLSEEQDALRTSLAPSLLLNLRHNIAHGTTGLRLFEIASTFHADDTKDTQTTEIMRIGLLMHGALYDQAWPAPATIASYVDMRGLCEHLFRSLGLQNVRYLACSEHPFLAPAIQIQYNDVTIGSIGRVMPAKANAMHAREAVWFAEIDIDPLHEHACNHQTSFVPLSIFPSSRRDITLIAPTSLSVASVLDAITNENNPLLAEATLHDVYEPEQTEYSDERNLTFRLTFRHSERTLKDKEVDKAHESISQALITKLGVRL